MSRKDRVRRIIFRASGVLFFLYLLSGLLLWNFQESLLLHPLTQPSGEPYLLKGPHREWMVPVNEKDSLHFIQFFSDTDSVRKGIVLFFHGNRDNILRYERYATWLTGFGYEVWMMDYPGFGKTTGSFSEERVYSDARLIYAMAEKQIGADSIVIYGKSLGTGIASNLAVHSSCKRLILETPYYSIPVLAWDHLPLFPTTAMSRYEFPVNTYLKQINVPVTIFHGTNDGVIPYRHSLRLKPALKTKDEFITVPGGRHNDLLGSEVFQKKMRELL